MSQVCPQDGNHVRVDTSRVGCADDSGGCGSMSILPPDKPAEFTASDILSADAWSGRAPRPVLGIDVACTKIAVDFQNMRRETVDECVRRNLELLREATGSDCAFLAAFHPNELVIEDV